MTRTFALLGSFAILTAGCHTRSRGPVLHVTVRSPDTQATAVDEVLTVGFDRDVAPDSAELKFEPPVEGTPRWIDARTLTFAPKSHWPVGTRVQISIPQSVRALDGAALGEEVAWTFTTPQAEMTGVAIENRRVWPGEYDLRWIPGDTQFVTHWTLDRDGADAARDCHLEVGEQKIVLEAKTEHGTDIALAPRKALGRGVEGKLVCVGVRKNHDGTAANYELAFRTRGDFQMIGHEPRKDGEPADEVHVQLQFTNPVEPDDAKKLVTIEPEPMSWRAHGGWNGTLTFDGEFEPSVTYRVNVSRKMKDRFGQSLDSDYHFRFKVGDKRPALSMQRGLFVVEASSPLYPLWTRNLPGVDIEMAKVPEDKLVAMLSGEKTDLKLEKRHLAAGGKKNHWNEGVIALPSRGVYTLTANNSHHVIANVTDLGVVAKLAPSGGLVWVTSFATGKAVAGAQVVIRDREGKVRWSGKTDEAGMATPPGRDKLLPRAPKPNANVDESEFEREEEWFGDRDDSGGELFVVVKSGGDLAVLGDRWQPGTAAWSFGISPDRHPGGTRVRGFLETDRGLYRPGDTVHVKGIVRTAKMGEPLRVLVGEKVALRVTDPRGDEILRKELKTGSFGGLAFDIPTTKESRLGDWRIEANVRDEHFNLGFSVEEYRPASFQVELKPRKEQYVIGDTLVADVRASYFYGAPLKGAKVHYSVRRRERFQSFGEELSDYTFYDRIALEDQGYYSWSYSSRSELVHEDDGETGDDGAFKIKVPLSADTDAHGPQDFLVEAEVADETGQMRTANVVVPTHRSAMYVGVHTDWLAQVGKPFPVLVVATDTRGKRVEQRGVELTVKLRSWDCSRHDGSYRCVPKDEPVATRTIDIPAGGAPASTTFLINKSGEITVTATSKDNRGRVVRASGYLYGWGGGDVAWRSDESTHLTLVPDRTSYKPGDTARVLVQAPHPGLALVTTERQGVLSKKLVELKTSAETIDVPLGDRDLPNVYLSVAMVRPRDGKGDEGRPRFKLGLTTLKVVPDSKRLAVKVSAEKASYRPGDKVKVALEVKDAAGKPVRAEVALAAADEGVLSLVAYKTPDPMAVFYAPWGLGVETSTSYERFAHRVEPTDEDDGGGVGDGGEGESAGRVRSHFLPTAFWHPAVKTNADGRAELSFDAPDQLTAFRLMAVAADAGDRFGSGESQFKVAKPFALHPMLPRFLTTGDTARLGVIVQNDTAKDGKVTVDATFEGVELKGARKQTVSVAKGKRVPVVYEVAAPQMGSAKFRFRSALGDEKDAVEMTIPIGRPSPMEVTTLAEGSTQAASSTEVRTPASAIPDQGELDLTIDGTGLAGATEGLRYLVEYPYGCLEQTTTKVVPLVALSDLTESMDLEELRGTRLREFIEAGVAKILRHQTDQGGFSLWPGGKPESYLTAFALYGLHQAKQAGYAVPDEPVERGLKTLREAVASGQFSNPYHQEIMGEAGSHAFALYVLAIWKRPEPGLAAKLFADREKLPRYGKAFLARAIAASSGDPEMVRTLVTEMTAGGAKKGDGVVLPEPAGDRLAFYFSDDSRSTALVLQTLLEVQPKNSMTDSLVKGLLAARDHEGHWQSTQSNFYGLTALASWAHGRSAKEVPVAVALGGRELFAGQLGGKSLRRVTVPLHDAHGTLQVAAKGQSVFYAARVRYAPRPETLTALANGFELRRELLDPETNLPITHLKVGQNVRVRLTAVLPEARNRIALVDRLPAGLEIIDSKKAGSYWDHVEAHDDRIEIFSEWMWSGTHTFEYLARATTAGTFVRPPATIEEMYKPDHRARTALETIEIQ